ncbi:MAG: LysR family transcriptional regulator [Kofleriaceae bacterium]
MHFVHRVRTVWSWLPAFRAVAETEHLPSAAQELGIVPSSLSRTVKQVEDELGISLFDRTSKALVLNQAGRTLVAAVREAMRIIDDALGTVVGDDLVGHVGAVASSDLVQTVLIPAGASLATTHPALALSALAAQPDEISEILLRGDADAAVITRAIPTHADLRVAELGTWSRSVYARPSRPVATDVRCVVVGTPTASLDDGWPAECERRIVAWAPDERSALELTARSDLLTVVSDAIIHFCGFEGRVTRLHEPQISPRTLYLVQRRAVGRHRRTEVLADALRAAAARNYPKS